jgi:integrase
MGDYPGRPYHRTRARLRGEVTALLDDGTGRIRPELQPFAENIIAMPKPDRARCWIRNNSRLRDYLQALGSGELALTHEAFHQLDSPRTAAHLRDLLMAAGALPPLDRQIALFTAWALPRLTATTEPEDRRLLAQFLHWHLLPTLHASSRRRPLRPGHRNSAAESFIWSQRLLRWARRRDRPLSQLSAADLDRWRCLHPDRSAQVFLRWAANTGHGPAYTPPPAARQPTPRLGPAQRTSLTQRMFTDNSIDLRTRVAACLLLVFAQPVSRLVSLTLDDLLLDDGGLYLQLGKPTTPVPAAVGRLVLELLNDRGNMNTAVNPTSDWLFPGGRAGQHLTAGCLRRRFQALGLPTTPARGSALQHLLAQAPAPVIASALGYNTGTTEHYREVAASPWNRYATSRGLVG